MSKELIVVKTGYKPTPEGLFLTVEATINGVVATEVRGGIFPSSFWFEFLFDESPSPWFPEEIEIKVSLKEEDKEEKEILSLFGWNKRVIRFSELQEPDKREKAKEALNFFARKIADELAKEWRRRKKIVEELTSAQAEAVILDEE